MNKICTICARAGSKGVKNKNLKIIFDRPLIAHSILTAIESNQFDYIAVSSDSDEILNVAREYGVNYAIKRPDEMATDFVSKIPAIRHCVESVEQIVNFKFDLVIDLDATSPLRNIQDITGAIDLLMKENVGNVITACPSRRSPYFNLVELNENQVVTLSKPLDTPILRRQDSPKCFDMNASIYVWKRRSLFQNETVFNIDTKLFVMPEERSIDIDTETDFLIVKTLLENASSKLL